MSDAAQVTFAEGYRPGVIGRITELHGVFYAHEWGVGAEFESQMAREICDFVEGYDPERDLLLSASVNGVIVGCIAILRPETGSEEARLRWFLLDPRCQGRGIGRQLLVRALRFARERYAKCYLWTVTGLPQSMHLYERFGFTPVAFETDSRYGSELKSVRMILDLAALEDLP
ncbi:MAG TPA: GNAT family N-acetyltransferase [Spirochaetia bacterium]|nr:GNAT family N-acetyltransferase [Spirochaetia bacterium]